MKKAVLVGVLLVAMIGLGGCFISVKEDCASHRDFKNPPIDSAIAEIDAAGKLGAESARVNVLKVIAQRPGLSPEARLHLVEAVGSLGNETYREEILMALAENQPNMSPPKPCGDKTK